MRGGGGGGGGDREKGGGGGSVFFSFFLSFCLLINISLFWNPFRPASFLLLRLPSFFLFFLFPSPVLMDSFLSGIRCEQVVGGGGGGWWGWCLFCLFVFGGSGEAFSCLFQAL